MSRLFSICRTLVFIPVSIPILRKRRDQSKTTNEQAARGSGGCSKSQNQCCCQQWINRQIVPVPVFPPYPDRHDRHDQGGVEQIGCQRENICRYNSESPENKGPQPDGNRIFLVGWERQETAQQYQAETECIQNQHTVYCENADKRCCYQGIQERFGVVNNMRMRIIGNQKNTLGTLRPFPGNPNQIIPCV